MSESDEPDPYVMGPPEGYTPPAAPPAPRLSQARRATWLQKARQAIAAAHAAADRGEQNRDMWVVVTSSYRIDIDSATDQGRRNAELIASGEFGIATAGLTPAHTAVGFRIASDPDLAT